VANTNLIGSTATVQESMAGSGTVQLNLTVPLLAYDVPNTVGSITYAVQGRINSGTLTINSGSLIAARELQI
jgi:hypothetical protein